MLSIGIRFKLMFGYTIHSYYTDESKTKKAGNSLKMSASTSLTVASNITYSIYQVSNIKKTISRDAAKAQGYLDGGGPTSPSDGSTTVIYSNKRFFSLSLYRVTKKEIIEHAVTPVARNLVLGTQFVTFDVMEYTLVFHPRHPG